ncbi:hypothetical protein HRW13_13170 [Streptomyces lunaelactis]|uniref:hypothetical protein n=1 Tax=Streptomyces lunaelactis TaxID=1535768 RepID=UPI001585AFB5|nr:hypothetical protein [Streptomyces lunaelactis]NUK41815.1 hypothetical protein [Streptomyces lunaelactis]
MNTKSAERPILGRVKGFLEEHRSPKGEHDQGADVRDQESDDAVETQAADVTFSELVLGDDGRIQKMIRRNAAGEIIGEVENDEDAISSAGLL